MNSKQHSLQTLIQLDSEFMAINNTFQEFAKLLCHIVETEPNGFKALSDIGANRLITGCIDFVTLGQAWIWSLTPVLRENELTMIGEVHLSGQIIFTFNKAGDTDVPHPTDKNKKLSLKNIDDVLYLTAIFIYGYWLIHRDVPSGPLDHLSQDFSVKRYIYEEPSLYL